MFDVRWSERRALTTCSINFDKREMFIAINILKQKVKCQGHKVNLYLSARLSTLSGIMTRERNNIESSNWLCLYFVASALLSHT